MLKCRNCEHDNNDGSISCANCGRLLIPDQASISEESLAEGEKCFICKRGELKPTKRFFRVTDSILKCNVCGCEFHQRKDEFELRQVPADSGHWLDYAGKKLSHRELHRIAEGGKSDEEIRQEEDRERAVHALAEQRQQEEEARLQEEQRLRNIPGTPQYYHAKFKQIIGMPENEEESYQWKIEWKTPQDARNRIRELNLAQKELRQLKKDINAALRQFRASTKEAIATIDPTGWNSKNIFGGVTPSGKREIAERRASARQLLEDTIEPYRTEIALIDNAILTIDKAKVGINAKMHNSDSSEDETKD